MGRNTPQSIKEYFIELICLINSNALLDLIKILELDNLYNANLYTPDKNWNTYNIINRKKRDLSYRNIMRVFHLMNEQRIQLDLLNCDDQDEYLLIYNWLVVQRWESSKQDLYANLSDEDRKVLFESIKTFDYFMDYDAYWCDFFGIGIDLTKDDIDFIKFGWLLDNKFMCDEKSAIANRIRMRTYKQNKNDSLEYKTNMNDLKRKYAFSDIKQNESMLDMLKGGGEFGRN